ncbi:MAG: phosphonate C-P lyase system protein PhnL [Lautropia sp.]
MITIERLCKRFTLHQRGGIVLDVLCDFSLAVRAGECVALTGASGRGKSTVLKCIDGNYGIDGGSVRLAPHGQPIEVATASPQAIRRLRATGLARVSQFLRAMPRVPAIDVVAERWLEGAVAAGAAEDGLANDRASDDRTIDSRTIDDHEWQRLERTARTRAAELLARLRLPESVWSLPPATFSGGEQQRVNIARALVRPVPILLLDEPTASLDPGNRDVVVELIREARGRGAAIVGIFHDDAVRAALADRCVAVGAPA